MLSPAQQSAVEAEGHVVVAACPGSGKSTLLTARAEHLLTKHPNDRLAAVTFTKEAADSLKGKIIKRMPSAATRVDAGTFHALCIQQLRNSQVRFRVLSEMDGNRIIQAAISRCPCANASGLVFDDYKAQIEEWMRELDPQTPPRERDALSFVYHAYIEEKRRYGVFDFSDMIRECVRGMYDGSVKIMNVQHMLVDEFQDTDNMQLEWVMAHVKQGVAVTIVGDDDQAIYGFRGSLGYAGMLEFKERTNARLINLDRTYRCTVDVLKPAAVLIEHNSARVPKTLVTASKERGSVHVYGAADKDDEAERVIETIMADGNYDEWAILSRTNAALETIESKINNRFPYSIKDGSSFWELKPPAMLLSLAKSMSGQDMLGLSDLLTRAGVSKTAMDNLSRQIRFESPGALDRFCDITLTKQQDRSGFITQMQGSVREWRQQLRSGKKSEFNLAVNGMANCVHRYGGWKAKEANDARKRLENAASSIMSVKGSMAQRLRTLTAKKETEGKGVSLLTFHASKGLEYDNVWIIGMDQGTVPSTKDGSDIAEERRLVYVAITRARKNIHLSYTIGTPSPFLEEALLISSGYIQKG